MKNSKKSGAIVSWSVCFQKSNVDAKTLLLCARGFDRGVIVMVYLDLIEG